jgi:SAM-dependent methyltransferase
LPDLTDLEARISLLERQVVLTEAHFTDAFWKAIDLAYDASLPHRRIRCIVCDLERPRDGFDTLTDVCLFQGGRLERYRCPRCECVFGPQKYLDLDEAFVSRDYRVLYARYSESDSTGDEVRTFRTLSPKVGGVFLDWGCGGAWSRTIDQLRGEGWDVWGYEPSAEAASNFIVNQRDAIGARFDGIFSNNVIEHFRDPVASFRDFHAILKDGGTMAHSSPCYEYRYAYSRFHTLFLLGKSPHVLAERTGFKVIDSLYDGDYITYRFERI